MGCLQLSPALVYSNRPIAKRSLMRGAKFFKPFRQFRALCSAEDIVAFANQTTVYGRANKRDLAIKPHLK
jgi:hypothetical protein